MTTARRNATYGVADKVQAISDISDGRLMAKVEIYTSPFCGYCHRAKRLLVERGAEIAEIDVMADGGKRREMVARAGGRRTVPQIFINGTHVGGCDELMALDRRGGLRPLLEQPT